MLDAGINMIEFRSLNHRMPFSGSLRQNVQIWLSKSKCRVRHVDEHGNKRYQRQQEYYGIEWAHIVNQMSGRTNRGSACWRYLWRQTLNRLWAFWTWVVASLHKRLINGSRRSTIKEDDGVNGEEGDEEEKEFVTFLRLLGEKYSQP